MTRRLSDYRFRRFNLGTPLLSNLREAIEFDRRCAPVIDELENMEQKFRERMDELTRRSTTGLTEGPFGFPRGGVYYTTAHSQNCAKKYWLPTAYILPHWA